MLIDISSAGVFIQDYAHELMHIAPGGCDDNVKSVLSRILRTYHGVS